MHVETSQFSPRNRRAAKTTRSAWQRALRGSLDRTVSRPQLRFTPYAWSKLEYWRDCGPTEIGAFGVSAADDLLLVENLHLVEQHCDVLSVAFEDASVADYFDRQVDLGLPPERFARIWIHTHPGHSAAPSALDEATFARVFGRSDWALMFILARGGACRAQLHFSVGPTASQRIAVAVDYRKPFTGSDHAAWLSEYQQSVRTPANHGFDSMAATASATDDDFWQW